MDTDIYLYENAKYIGFATIDTFEEYFRNYYQDALKAAENESWDMVILYAIIEYDVPSNTIYSADFMKLVMPNYRYVELVSKLSDECRLFFLRGRREIFDDYR